MLALLIVLSACATDRPNEYSEEKSTGPTIYEQLSVSVDQVSAGQ